MEVAEPTTIAAKSIPAEGSNQTNLTEGLLLALSFLGIEEWLWCAVCGLAIPGNILTILLVWKNSQLQTPSNLLIAALAVADLVVGINGLTCQVIWKFVDICDAYVDATMEVLIISPIITAACHVLLIGLDRYVAIVFPLRYETIMNTRLIKRLVASTWLVMSCACLSVFRYSSKDECKTNVPIQHTLLVNVLVYVSCAVLLVILYTKIMLIARRHTKQIATITAAVQGATAERRKNKTTKTLLYILVAYLMAWTPYCICISAYALAKPQTVTGELLLASLLSISTLIGLANSSINFVIYAWTNKTFRRGYIDLVTCR